MITIFHKSNCSTSLAALKLIKESGKKYKIRLYLESPPDLVELKNLVELLQVSPETVVRKKEQIFKDKYAGKKHSDLDWLKMIVKHPILLERPILIKGKKALLARPAERASEFL